MKQRLVELIRAGINKHESTIENYAFPIWEFLADYLIENGVIVLPCKVGDKYYKVERWCTEGGFLEKPKYAYSSTCEDCCEECDGKDEIVEYTFNSPQQILSLERTFGQYVFLTREEAEAKLKERDSN